MIGLSSCSACLAVVTACVMTLGAQRQTGAPAGIPVPTAPRFSDSTSDAAGAPQSFSYRVRVVDGRNGSAIRDAHVKLWYDEPAGPGYRFVTDAQGYGNMPAPVGQPIRVLADVTDYTDCRRPQRDDPPAAYNLHVIESTGMAAHNGCGRVATHTLPGELVLFVRPARWYEGINRNAGN